MRSARTLLADAAVALAATVAWTWPLAPRLGEALRDRYDGRTQAWVVSWVAHALRTSPFDVFQANAFAPSRDVLAFSEPLVGYGAVALPFALAGLGPVALLNLLCVLGLALSAFCLARLAAELGAPRDAAWLGTFAAAFGALSTVQLGFVSFTAWGGVAGCALFALRLLRGEGRGRDAALLAFSTGLLGWFSLHLLAFALAALLALAAVRLARDVRGTLPRLPRIALALAAAGLLLSPLALKMLRVKAREGFATSAEDALSYSARPASWLATTSYNPGQSFLPFRSDSEKALYPGSSALALALAGLVLRRRPPEGRRLAEAGAVLVAVGVLGSLGPHGPLLPLLAGALPPLWGGIRAAARFGFVAQAGFGLLAALGAARFLGLAPTRRARVLLAGALLTAIAADVRQAYPFDYLPEPPPPVESFLAAACVGGPILHLPATFEASEAEVLLDSTAHFKPVVNGTLSHVPNRCLDLGAALAADPPSADLLDRLEAWPVGVLVVHEHRLSLERRGAFALWLDAGVHAGRLSPPLVFPHRDGTDWVFGLSRVRGRTPWGAPGGGDSDANALLLARVAAAGPAAGAGESPDLLGAIDEPGEGAVVRGALRVRGWAQDESGPAEVVDVLVDGERRAPLGLARTARPDAAAAFPTLGDTSSAGWELGLRRFRSDAGPATLEVRFRSPGGRTRTLRRGVVFR
jgi:hypothetical protein